MKQSHGFRWNEGNQEDKPMSRKPVKKEYWEMNAAELAAATTEFDQEFDESQFKPLTPEERAWWKSVLAKLRSEMKDGVQTIAVHVEKALLDRCTALAKKKRISRDCLIARGLRAVLAAEGEG
jgi:hypothetical protein